MADVTISYKDDEIATMSATGVKTLLTGDTFCEDDIVVSYTKPSPSLQTKTATPTTSQQTISPDSGYDGLSSVTVNAISPTQGAQTIYPSTSDQTISSGRYLTGTQTIKAVTTTNLSAGNIKSGVTVKVGDSADDDRVASVTGSYSGIDVSDTTATASDVLSGKYFYTSAGTKTQGSIATKTSSNMTVSGATVTAPAGYYASNASKSVASGTATSASSISATGASVSTGTNTLTLSKSVSNTPRITTAGYISSGTAGNSSVSLTASVTTKAATTFHPSTSDQTISSGTYLTGTQTIKAVTHNLTAGDIKDGVTLKIGDSTDDDCVASVTGTYSGGGGGGGSTTVIFGRIADKAYYLSPNGAAQIDSDVSSVTCLSGSLVTILMGLTLDSPPSGANVIASVSLGTRANYRYCIILQAD